MEIISKSNQNIQEAKKLLQKKFRDQSNLFLAETKKVVLEAFKANLVCKKIFLKSGTKFLDIPKGVPVFELSESAFAQISSVVTPDGVIGIFEKKQTKREYFGGNFLILDKLQNPDNFGAIVRSAVASDFLQIFVIDCVDEYSPKTIRASMGNIFKAQIMHINYDDMCKMFSNAKLYTASMEGKDVFASKFQKNVGIVIGNEGNGISEQIRRLKLKTISIPMQNGVESLNASVSASIIMYQVFKSQ